jgi:hypothetical protein
MYKYTEMVLNYDLQSLQFIAHHNMAALLHKNLHSPKTSSAQVSTERYAL